MDTSIEFLIRAGQADTADALREYAERRLSFALRRFARQVQRATVRLVDVNGPRRGVDSRCSMPQTWSTAIASSWRQVRLGRSRRSLRPHTG
jgi:hypothetical protein